MSSHVMLQIAVLAEMCLASGPASPTAKELLDRFAATMDRCQTSYACTEEGTRVSVIKKAPSPPFRLGEHTWHYWREYRWDGQRFRRRERAWGEYEKEPFPLSRSKEQAEYHITLYDLDRTIEYSTALDDRPKPHMTYTPWRWDRQAVLRDASNNNVVIPRVDVDLRTCPNAKVRPTREPVNGVDCYVIEGRTAEAKFTVWIDPNHGYNVAKWIRETLTGYTVTSTIAFRRIDGTWIPVERATQMTTSMPIDQQITEQVKVIDFKIAPDHAALKSFEVDEEIPNGTSVGWVLPDRRVLMDYVWKDGKPVREAKK